MIQKPTVLILGAGASIPFGFPSGIELLREVLKLPLNAEDQAFLNKAGFTDERGIAFKHALRHSGRESVDAFLERRTDLIPIGKAFMALALIKHEHHSTLFDEQKKGSNWYDYLFAQMDTGFGNFGNNRVTILTYNYDRSLEYYLATVLQNAYDKSEEEVAKELKKLSILHLHGNLGNLPFQGGKAREYGANSYDDFVTAKDGIRIIHESTEGVAEFKQARERLLDAEVICFLGFGYHTTNVRRLNLEQIIHNKNVSVTGSAFNLDGPAQERICNELFDSKIKMVPWDILRFLKEVVRLNESPKPLAKIDSPSE